MTREEAIAVLKGYIENPLVDDTRAFEMAIKALEQEPCREQDDYENEIEDLHNRLNIAEYDKEKLREEVTNLETQIKALEQEPKTDGDCINRQAAIDAIYDHEYKKDMRRAIEELPSVNPKESKTGCWIKHRDFYGDNHFTCPFCEHDIATKADTLGDNYCSNCGAKLQESEE